MDTFQIAKLLRKDRQLLQTTQLPIVTVAGSFRRQLSEFHNQDLSSKTEEVLFSRAHYSMAVAVAIHAWNNRVNPSKAWLVDPTNYVSAKDWNKIEFTEEMGKIMARNPLLKFIKDLIDTKVRSKLPITDAITHPLLFLFEHVHHPILSFHYEAGNILAGVGKFVVQVVTDPHIRDQYLEHAELSNIRFCVFDANTKVSLIEKAATLGKFVDPKRVIVTGPPVDPRVVACRKLKKPQTLRKTPLQLLITTGGLGTNKTEIETCVRSLAPLVRRNLLHLIVYVGVHEDIRESIHAICKQEGIPTSLRSQTTAACRILYSPHIVEANEDLIKYGFPWADGVVTKPSGDMAYDAAAAGCFLLTLDPWGEWEHNIRDIFEQKAISRRAIPEEFAAQVEALLTDETGQYWMEEAIGNALKLPKLFLEGASNIAKQATT